MIVADPARNLVFVPTSSPNHDYFGGERLGDNLFANSVVALRADTGARVWHFQTVHHDLWDYDVASPPILFDWRKDGRTVAGGRRRLEDRPSLHPESRDRRAAHSGRGARRPEERRAGRDRVADAAVSHGAASARAARRLKPSEAWGATDEDRAWCRDTMSALRNGRASSRRRR